MQDLVNINNENIFHIFATHKKIAEIYFYVQKPTEELLISSKLLN